MKAWDSAYMRLDLPVERHVLRLVFRGGSLRCVFTRR
jgi:hypothetical protein